MNFRDFERQARQAFDEIPEEFKEGIDGLTVSREAVAHPTLSDVFTMGQCVTEEHLSDYGSAETTRSVIALYWGSFRELAELDVDFDWDAELWETLTHELRHHLESLAGDDALEGVDYAADELFKRQEGQAFDPWYYQKGEDLGGGVYLVEGNYHVEQVWRPEDFERATEIVIDWRGVRYAILRPSQMGDIHFVRPRGTEADEGQLELVIVRRRSGWTALRRLFGGPRPVILESESEVERVDGG